MRTLTEQERRTIRIAVIGVIVYLGILYGPRAGRFLAFGGGEQQRLAEEVEAFKRELGPYENRLLRLEKLRGEIEIERVLPGRLGLVAEVSAAIQNAATGSGIRLGPIRESAGRPAAKELASMRVEGAGPLASVLGWLNRLETLGYPLIVDGVQVEANPQQPDMIKLNLTIIIVDVEQWRRGGPGDV